MNDRVDGQRQARGADQRGSLALGLLRAGEAGDAIARTGLGILQAELHVLEPGLDEAAQPIGVEPDAGRD
jgi:hypothetical protein